MEYSTSKNQQDIVSQNIELIPEKATVRIAVPGIKTLHTRSTEEIAEVLTNVIKSQSNVIEIKYVLGEYIELIKSS
jgi:hypothetical protein